MYRVWIVKMFSIDSPDYGTKVRPDMMWIVEAHNQGKKLNSLVCIS